MIAKICEKDRLTKIKRLNQAEAQDRNSSSNSNISDREETSGLCLSRRVNIPVQVNLFHLGPFSRLLLLFIAVRLCGVERNPLRAEESSRFHLFGDQKVEPMCTFSSSALTQASQPSVAPGLTWNSSGSTSQLADVPEILERLKRK